MRQLKALYDAVKELVKANEDTRKAMAQDSPLGKAMIEAGKFLYRAKGFEYNGAVTGSAYASTVRLVGCALDLDDAVRLVLDNGKEISGNLEIYLINNREPEATPKGE